MLVILAKRNAFHGLSLANKPAYSVHGVQVHIAADRSSDSPPRRRGV